ncbi:hypothetical protein RN001_003626 [Aquatica leii]|uniref:Zinc finger PHD-type domain-containing protein n=1 Tax=Aquatica leii TaxID=1421715 RepID=A0AAN7ST23_9COLE|nr:hypothetical protein RN001_003626 [Aquatica leii]
MEKDVNMNDPYERVQKRLRDFYAEILADEDDADPFADSTGDYGSDEDYILISELKKKAGTRGRKGGQGKIVTSTPNKEELKESLNLSTQKIKQKVFGTSCHFNKAGPSNTKSKMGKQQKEPVDFSASEPEVDLVLNDSSDQDTPLNCVSEKPTKEDVECIFCQERFSTSRSRKIWLRCVVCNDWAHEACTTGEEYHKIKSRDQKQWSRWLEELQKAERNKSDENCEENKNGEEDVIENFDDDSSTTQEDDGDEFQPDKDNVVSQNELVYIEKDKSQWNKISPPVSQTKACNLVLKIPGPCRQVKNAKSVTECFNISNECGS